MSVAIIDGRTVVDGLDRPLEEVPRALLGTRAVPVDGRRHLHAYDAFLSGSLRPKADRDRERRELAREALELRLEQSGAQLGVQAPELALAELTRDVAREAVAAEVLVGADDDRRRV